MLVVNSRAPTLVVCQPRLLSAPRPVQTRAAEPHVQAAQLGRSGSV
jgi:hypothetical protein